MTDSEERVTRLFGGPGSGKTTALLDRVESIMDRDDVEVDDVLLVSYTRAAAAEVRERLAERLDVSPRALRGNVCTMHAKAYDLLDLSRGDVVDESDKTEFCEEYGLPYEDEYEGAARRTARSTTLGNKVIATSQWLQRTGRDVADWYDVPFQWNVEKVRLPPDIDPNAQEGNKYTPTWPSDDDRFDVPEAIRAWRTYKGEHDLVGFADMLERVKQRALVPDVDYLVIDEFQDITTLQYEVYDSWKPHVDKVLVAGDDDQVVYAWQGADPQLLLEEAGNSVILDTSHRLPSKILQVVQREVRHIDERQEKNLSPRKEGGAVEAVQSPSMLDLVRNVRATVQEDSDGSVMVLFRARYQMFRFIDEFITDGMPFQVMTDQRMWTDRLAQFVNAVEAVDEDEPIDGLQAQRLANMLADSAFGTNDRDPMFDAIEARKEEEDVEDLTELTFDPDFVTEHAPFMPDPVSAAEMIRKVTSFQKKSMKAYFAGEYREMPRDQVRIGTIHSAKGREADHVFVATDLTEKVVEQMAATVRQQDIDVPGVDEFTKTTDPVPTVTDNERRVFYVGMSRARERLVVLENLVDGAPTLPIDVLLTGAPTDRDPQDIIDETTDDVVEAEAAGD
ncbi:ATP-dependent DNA helicase Rep [Halobacteriales archaeon QS_1_68_20]|nr:MAG: ATP-dependent DNA helicase Rep [Halobacteriales archaeon QS_1_68_20]